MEFKLLAKQMKTVKHLPFWVRCIWTGLNCRHFTISNKLEIVDVYVSVAYFWHKASINVHIFMLVFDMDSIILIVIESLKLKQINFEVFNKNRLETLVKMSTNPKSIFH